MRTGRLGALASGLRYLHRPPDLAAMRSARSPEELARLTLVPAAHNLGVAIGFLPAAERAEATVALLAWRVLTAYDHVSDRPPAACVHLAVLDYLNGEVDVPPRSLQATAVRDGAAVDLVLAERIRDVRELLSKLSFEGRERIGRLLSDVGRVMAANRDRPLSRTAYGERVLGRVVLYLCSLVAEDDCAEGELSELAGCVGLTAQLADDLDDGELELYGAHDRDELVRTVMLSVLTPALGSIALLARLGSCVHSRGARVAIAHLAIATTSFLCAAVGAPAPFPRPVRLAAAVLASASTAHWARLVERVRCCVDGAIHCLLDASSHPMAKAGPASRSGAVDLLAGGDPPSMPPSVGPLIVRATFALVEALPVQPLTGEVPALHVRRMMIADHLAFSALERLRPADSDGMLSLAKQFQVAAQDSLSAEYTHKCDQLNPTV